MSAFLGPIHHWLYHKVQLQEELMAEVQALAAREGWTVPAIEGLNPSGTLPPLEGNIDLTNIHGWLQGQIAASETRYARLTAGLLAEDDTRLAALEETARAFGRGHGIPAGTDAQGAFQALNDSLLDGMPCDHVNQVVERDEKSISWKRTQCLHGGYWEQAGVDAEIYYKLRLQIILGMLEGSGLSLEAGVPGNFKLIEGGL